MKCIILIGYMCAGKTTIGRSLATKLNRTFYDLDWYVEERFHKSIPEIFANEGEATFRDLEHRMLHEVAEFENIVLSSGGGTPCFFDNISYMNQVAETIYLKASPETLLRHLSMARGTRPLLKGMSPEERDTFIRKQLEERSPYYEQARHIVELEVLENAEKIENVVTAICRTIMHEQDYAQVEN